jgi:putative membrane protein
MPRSARVIPRFNDHAANERTYLAWVRTAIAVMAFGFLVERFDLFLTYASQNASRAAHRLHLHLRTTEWVGLLLIVFGALIILLASARFLRNRRDIAMERMEAYSGPVGEKLLAAILVLLGLFLVVYVGQELAALGSQPDV